MNGRRSCYNTHCHNKHILSIETNFEMRHGESIKFLCLIAELPDTSFTRSISNPEAVMRRRRQQKLEKKLQQFRSKVAKY